MKRILIAALTLMLVLALCVSVGAAETAHPHTGDHCVCGGAAVGVGDHTECKNVQWTPISEAFKAVGLTMSTADFGKLPSGNFYLDGDVTVTGASPIGAYNDSTKLQLEPDEVEQLTICLNGYNITRSGSGKAFGFLHMKSELTICDCSYDGTSFGGTVTGGSYNYGSLIYTYSKSVLNIYGGNFVGKSTVGGGTFVIACDLCGDIDGNGAYEEKDRNKAGASVMNLYNGYISGSTVSSSGGTIQLFHPANLNMYGGTVVGGTAGTSGGAISGSTGTIRISGGNVIGGTAGTTGGAINAAVGRLYITGGTMTGGTCKAGLEVAQVIQNDGKVLGTYTSFADALAKAQNSTNSYLRLLNDLETSETISGTLYLDMNGHNLTGVNITGTVYGMDCTTNNYDDSAAGTLTPASGKPQQQVKTAQSQTGSVRRYVALESEGSYSFHRIYLGITKITLKPGTVGIGYKATFAGGEKVAAALKKTVGFGYKMWLNEDVVITRGYNANRFEKTQELTLRIDNFLDAKATTEENAARAEMDVYAVPFLCLADGTEILGTTVNYDMHQMLELADNAYAGYTEKQQASLQKLGGTFSRIMMSWDVENIHHASGGMWVAVTNSTFNNLLRNNSNNLPSNNYVLLGDVDIGTRSIKVEYGKTVSICLNGYTLKSSAKLFNPYGTLNICDCHAHDAEGTLQSDLSGEATHGAVAYCRAGAVVNLYGGHLKATGKVAAAGAVAVSHDVKEDPTRPSAIFNMYGGSISGGQTYNNGGLICIWNKATFNMYGGELYGGTAGTNGGAIDASGGTLNIQGGKIYGNTAGKNGGGIYVSGRTVQMQIAGGTVTGNTAAELGDGVYVYKSAVTVSGDAQITGNTTSNLYADFYSQVHADGLSEGAQVGMTSEATRRLSESTSVAAYISSDDSSYTAKNVYGGTVLFKNGMTPASSVSGFQVGFGETNITPTMEGIPLAGYSNPTERLSVNDSTRNPDYDDIKCQSVAITDENGTTVILIYADLVTYDAAHFDYFLDAVAAATGVPEEHIFINVSHSHSVPSIGTTSVPAQVEYNKTLPNLFAQSALQAMNDRASATMETGSFEVQQTINGKTQYYNFYRHYSYEEDGIVKYFGDQFGTSVYNSTTKHIRDADHTMHLVRFVRSGKDILMSNWRIHPHFVGSETSQKLTADAIGTIRYYMAQLLPDTHYVYFQGAAGNMNENSRLTTARVGSARAQSHGLNYVKYGEAVAKIIVNNLGCLKSEKIGLLQLDHYDYLAKADNPSDEEYTKAKAVYDIFVEETQGMTLGQKNTWVKEYCEANPEYNYISAFQLGFIVNRRYTQKDTELPLNVVTLGKTFALFTGPFELWDSISMEVEEKSPFKTTFCLGYSMGHQHYMVYYPEYADSPNGVPYDSYESENRHFKAPDTVRDMIDYWTEALNRLYNS